MGEPEWWMEMKRQTVREEEGAALRRKREALGWSRKTAAYVTGLSPSYIGRVERGEVAASMSSYRAFELAYKAAPGE